MTGRHIEVAEVAGHLDGLVVGVDDRVSISVETDLDEAFFVGTPAALVRLAAALLRAASGDAATQVVSGVKCGWSTHTHSASDPLAPVVAGAECVVATDEDRKRVVEHFQALAGDRGLSHD